MIWKHLGTVIQYLHADCSNHLLNFYIGNVDHQSIFKKWLHHSSKHGTVICHQCKTAPPQKPMKYVLAIAKLYRSLVLVGSRLSDHCILGYLYTVMHVWIGGGVWKNGPGLE